MYFQTEFAVVVISDLDVLVFGAGQGYQKRVYVLYDGTHYNLAISKESKTFHPSDDRAYQGCLDLAEECNKKGEACDPSVFSLVCF